MKLTAKNLKYLLILILTIICFSDLKGQEILVEKSFNGNTHYGQHSKVIESADELPDAIQNALKAYMTDMFGRNIKSVSYSHGQRIDLKGFFSEPGQDVSTFRRLVPSYDLNFILSDSTIGIKSYYVQIRLDEYGQLLSTNWPRKGYSNKFNFVSTHEIMKFALEQAKLRGYRTSNYITDLQYQSSSASLNWVFKFPKNLGADNKQWNVLEISLTSLKVVEEYNVMNSKVN